MSEWIFIIMGLTAALIIILGIIITVLVWKKKKEGTFEEPNYFVFFVLGICFLPMGTVFMATVGPAFIGFTGMGLCYMAMGLAHRDSWQYKQ